MKDLKFSGNAFALYIKGNRFIAFFDSLESAQKFAKRYYNGEEAHVEPITIYTFMEP